MSEYTCFMREQQCLAEHAWAEKQARPESQPPATILQEILVPATPELAKQAPGASEMPVLETPRIKLYRKPPSVNHDTPGLDGSLGGLDKIDNRTHRNDKASTLSRTDQQKIKRVAGYQDRQELARRMLLEPSDTAAIRQRRAFLKVQCVRQGQALHRPFESCGSDTMSQLVKTVNNEMQAQYGDWWPSDLTRDLIHAICIDNVRNDGSRSRREQPLGDRLNIHHATIGKMSRRIVESAESGHEATLAPERASVPETTENKATPSPAIDQVIVGELQDLSPLHPSRSFSSSAGEDGAAVLDVVSAYCVRPNSPGTNNIKLEACGDQGFDKNLETGGAEHNYNTPGKGWLKLGEYSTKLKGLR